MKNLSYTIGDIHCHILNMRPLHVLDETLGQPLDFPPLDAADEDGLLAVGLRLDADALQTAYARGIFPWFGPGDPVLWWSPTPRMVLKPQAFRLHRSLRKTIACFIATAGCEIRIDHDFRAVMQACASAPRAGQDGTWIVPTIVDAYTALHERGLAHSVETWVDGRCVGGLYCVALGRAVYGESMFARQTDASKIALAALVALCRAHDVPQIDCQQVTSHLASLGAAPIDRAEFVRTCRQAQQQRPMHWCFEPAMWALLDERLGEQFGGATYWVGDVQQTDAERTTGGEHDDGH